MWQATVVFISVVSFVFLLRTISRNRDPYLVFVLSAIYLRFLLSAYPQFVVPKIVAGLSLNAVGAMVAIGAGILVVQKKYFLTYLLTPLYLFLVFMIFSGLVNFEIKGLIIGSIRLVYLIVIQLALFVALQRLGPNRVFSALLTVFILPVGSQVASILLNHPKGASGAGEELLSLEGDSSVSYIGPYFHDSGFSMILLSMLVVTMFWRPSRSSLYWAVVAAAMIGLAYANYRTAILSALPIFLAILVTRYYLAFVKSQRAAALTVIVIIGLPIAYAGVTTTPIVIERFESLTELTDFEFSMTPTEFTYADRRLLSSRMFIWSRYFYAVSNASFVNQLIGHGPESWRTAFYFYAHNTYVSYYYEFGIIGVIIFALYWLSNLVLCFRVKDGVTFVKLFSGYMGFTILSLATMPLWQIEGNLLLALLNGTLMYEVSRSKRSGRPPEHRARLQDSKPISTDLNRPS